MLVWKYYGKVNKMDKIKILIVDDHPVVSEGLTTILSYKDQNIEIIGTAIDGVEAINMYAEYKPDIILMDIKMPNCDGIAATRKILARDPSAKIIMLTTFDDVELINNALDTGAKGYLMKDSKSDQILQAIRSVKQGNILMSNHVADVMRDKKKDNLDAIDELNRQRLDSLSFRHKEILILMADGLSNTEIGESLYISEKTVRNYVSIIYDYLDIHTRPHVILWAQRYRKYLGRKR